MMGFATLHPSYGLERAALDRAAPKRRNEFSSGRVYARAALAALDCPRCPIGVGADRLPHWPSGYIGSISHCSVWCTAAAGRDRRYAGIGVDIESDEPLPAAMQENICRPDEAEGVLDIHGYAVDSAK
jgi:4'-phosphopantetheinyl transferase EntD